MSLATLRGLTIATALLATIGSTLSVYPHQLAYFNEVAGGPKNGYKHLLHSNLDWGQDIFLVREWVDERNLKWGEFNVSSHAAAVSNVVLESALPSERPSSPVYDIVSSTKMMGSESDYSRFDPVDRIGFAYWVFRLR